MQQLHNELAQYYNGIRNARLQEEPPSAAAAAYRTRRERIRQRFADGLAAAPDSDACARKATLMEAIAEECEPVLFPHSPFYFELGVRPAENWGNPGPLVAAALLLQQNTRPASPAAGRIAAFAAAPRITRPEEAGRRETQPRLWQCNGDFDIDHHSLGYTRLLAVGVNGILAEIDERRRTADSKAAAFLHSAARTARALLRCAERFAERAEAMRAGATDPAVHRNLDAIAATARRIPAEPPRTFYEGLAAILFLREATASLEGIGISVLGHLDRLLIDLYRRDCAAGRMDEAQAGDLLARWMAHTDAKFHLDDNAWPETSTCLPLGGCDAAGRPVWNELSRLVIETHRAHGLTNPKLNVRLAPDAPPDSLRLVAESVLAGHNHFALLNDEVLIPACVRAGKTEAEARLYVNGGCQETICEGVEHSAGAYYYLNMARVLDLTLQPLADGAEVPADLVDTLPAVIEAAPTFEAFYQRYRETLFRTMAAGASWLQELGRDWSDRHPCPWFSTTLDGCIESGRDYTAGGARHNPAGIALNGFATVVDSLHVVRTLVYEEGAVTLAGLRCALAADWRGHEALRARAVALPKFGHGEPAVDALAARFAAEVAAFCRTLRNERGGPFQASLFVYYMFVHFGRDTRATPDGRRAGDLLSQGVAPGRVRPCGDLPATFASLGAVDLRDYPGNALLDVQLPIGASLDPDRLAGAIRAFCRMGGATLQLNAVSPDTLRDARIHPERHRDLTVRISGLSARFVALEEQVQDEILARTLCHA